MLKHIPQSWKDDLRTNFDSSLNFYINPRARTIPALTSAGVSYIKNDATTNMRGTYRMQCGGSTDLTYLYTLPQRFILEGWFKPEFAYNVAGDQTIFTCATAAQFSVKYEADTDTFDIYCDGSLVKSSNAYTSDAALQKWHYIRVWIDTTGGNCGVILYTDWSAALDATFTVASTIAPGNTISFFPTVAAESSYWIIHEVEEALATDEFKTYRSDRQIMFDFNGTTLARERIRIPRNSEASDLRGVKSIDSLHYAVENQGGSACANSAALTLYNIKGQFSDDQYDAFDPFQGYYNGTTYQKYLQNRVEVEIESCSKRFAWMAPRADSLVAGWPLDEVPDIPDGAAGTSYIQDQWLTTDSFTALGGCSLSVSGGQLLITADGTSNGCGAYRATTPSDTKTVRVRIKYNAKITHLQHYNGSTYVSIPVASAILSNGYYIFNFVASTTSSSLYLKIITVGIVNGDILYVDWIYVGTGAYTTVAPDGSGHGIHGTMYGCTPGDDGLIGDGVNDYISMGNNGRITGALSLVIKVKRISTVDTAGLFGKYLTTGNQRSYLLDIYSSSYPRFLVSGTGASAITVQHDVSLSDTEFETLICVFIPSTSITIYRGGVQVAQNTTSIPAALYDCTANLELFRSADHAVYANVEIEYAAIYDRALGTDEILGLSLGLRPSLPYRLADWTEEQAQQSCHIEPLIIGRTTPGAFARNSPNGLYGEVSIEVEDGVAELGETKMAQSYSFATHDICDPAAESDSLVHDIARLVTKKTIYNYCLNSSVENATIANSWTNSGMATFERSNTQALFGTYSMKCIADTIGDKVTQVIEFETTDLIDIGDTFNFSAFIYQGTGEAVKITIEELDTDGSLLGSASETACGTDTSVWTRVNVSRTILSASCTQLRIGVQAVATSTFYADGFMLTRGYDPLDYFLLNATDGASGVGSADSAASYSYDTVGIDADAVDIEHPYALVKKGDVVWDHLKKISDASVGYYLGMTPDGTLRFANRYAEAGTSTPSNLGTVDDFGGIATSLETEQANAVRVYGYAIETGAKTQLFSAMNAAGFIKVDGKVKHPVANGAAMSVSGSTTVECVYAEATTPNARLPEGAHL